MSFELGFANGAETVDANGTAQPVSTTDIWVRSVTFQARKAAADNVGDIYIGGSNLSSSNGIKLTPGTIYTYAGDAGHQGSTGKFNLANIYIDADNNDDGVTYMYSLASPQNNA